MAIAPSPAAPDKSTTYGTPATYTLSVPAASAGLTSGYVSLSWLLAGQGHLEYEKVESLRELIDRSSPDEIENLLLRGSATGSAGGNPAWVKWMYGRPVVMDGHHRLFAYMLQGKSRAPVLIDYSGRSDGAAFGGLRFTSAVLFGAHPPLLQDFGRQGLYIDIRIEVRE